MSFDKTYIADYEKGSHRLREMSLFSSLQCVRPSIFDKMWPIGSVHFCVRHGIRPVNIFVFV